jgi:uncharacterized protein YjbI with pentapeptide repeats
MANPEHLARLLQNTSKWNHWRSQHPDVVLNLRGADLCGADLNSADLSDADLFEADLKRANLCRANFTRANLGKTNLHKANMRQATLKDAQLSGANLKAANLREVKMTGATLVDATLAGAHLYLAEMSGADLGGATLIHANLNEAVLHHANLENADLRGANLSSAHMTAANLSKTNLQSANLQFAKLDDGILTDAQLWEMRRAGWSIKGIQCERAYWDRFAKQPTAYGLHEFERLYSEQTCIELFYQGGVSTFELNTLPALLQHLASLHSDSNIRLKSIEETGGGARISISVGDAGPETAEKIKADAMQVYHAQLALREKEAERLQIEKSYLESLFLGRLIPAMLSASAPQNVFNAPVAGLVLASGDAKVNFHQTVNDNSALMALLEHMIGRRADLRLSASENSRFENEIESAKDELQKQNPDPPALKRSIQFIQKLAAEALTRAADKVGEQVISGDWSTWLHELGRFVSHLG